MPRKSPYLINLSGDEERELRARAASYTLPYGVVVRARMILMAAQGLDSTVIAERLNANRSVVAQWRKRFASERLAGLDEKARSGRPAERMAVRSADSSRRSDDTCEK